MKTNILKRFFNWLTEPSTESKLLKHHHDLYSEFQQIKKALDEEYVLHGMSLKHQELYDTMLSKYKELTEAYAQIPHCDPVILGHSRLVASDGDRERLKRL